ncbi:MAG: Thiol-disulfide isomerase and thioredoxin [Pseudomonadota bacterium]
MSRILNRRSVLLGGAAVAAVAAGAAVSWRRLSPVTPADGAVAEFYALTLNDADGKPLALKQFTGKSTVVNFWATWCAPCVEEMPEFDAVAKSTAAQGLRFVGIAIDSPSNMREFREKVQVSYPLLSAGFGGTELAKAFGNTTGGLPFTVLISAQGAILQRKMGRLKESELREWITHLR